MPISEPEGGKERRRGEGRKRRMGSSAKAGSRWWTPDRCRMCIFLFRPKSCILIRIVSVSLVSDFDENCKAVRNRPTPGEKKNIYICVHSREFHQRPRPPVDRILSKQLLLESLVIGPSFLASSDGIKYTNKRTIFRSENFAICEAIRKW